MIVCPFNMLVQSIHGWYKIHHDRTVAMNKGDRDSYEKYCTNYVRRLWGKETRESQYNEPIKDGEVFIIGLGLMNEWIRAEQKDDEHPVETLLRKLKNFRDAPQKADRLLLVLDEIQDVQDEFVPFAHLVQQLGRREDVSESGRRRSTADR